ncbi:hypothetical protein ACM26V_00135 [Salipaludibacillus sp. HK11]|uniref:hypothetical protein n=1 Tax=Salipaludibacillus sp. HK11 TaxID=3394320 RepID=UPI0039FD04B8
MSVNKWVRSISFNKTNEKDIARLKLIGKKSFSKFIKKLLDDEIKRQTIIPSATSKTAKPPQQKRIVPPNKQRPVRPQIQNNPMLRRN